MSGLAGNLPQPMTAHDFIAWAADRPRSEKWELLAGVPVAMAGGTLRHDTIAQNIAEVLGPQVRRHGCRGHRDLFVVSPEDGNFTAIPDWFVRCGPGGDTRVAVDDPIAIIEVLSPSTLIDDRGYKLRSYLRMPSVLMVALIYQREQRIEVWSRQPDAEWPKEPAVLQASSDMLALPTLGAAVALGDIYDGVALD